MTHVSNILTHTTDHLRRYEATRQGLPMRPEAVRGTRHLCQGYSAPTTLRTSAGAGVSRGSQSYISLYYIISVGGVYATPPLSAGGNNKNDYKERGTTERKGQALSLAVLRSQQYKRPRDRATRYNPDHCAEYSAEVITMERLRTLVSGKQHQPPTYSHTHPETLAFLSVVPLFIDD